MLLAALLWSCSSDPLDCAPVAGVEDLLGPATPSARVVLVGEMHGTVESPGLAAELACHALKLDKPVVLALEQPATQTAALQAALKDGDRAALLASPFFARPTEEQDGRSSGAVADLVIRAHRWHAAGKPIDLVAFDAEPGATKTSAEREKVMADQLEAARAAHPDAVLIALTGNLHARRTPGLPWDPGFLPMGARLTGPGVVSVLARASNGEAWTCQSDGGCKTRSFGDPAAAPVPLAIEKHAQLTDGYDAAVELGRFTASPPAVP